MTTTQQIDLSSAADAAARLVANVRDDQLDQPTPCSEYDVATLLEHVGELAVGFRLSATKQPMPDGPSLTGGDAANGLPDDWRERIPADLAALGEAWRDPAAHEGTTTAGPFEMPAPEVALVALNELVVHGWDVAVATGQEPVAEPRDLETCLGFVGGLRASEQAAPPDFFAPPVPVAEDARRWTASPAPPAATRPRGAPGTEPTAGLGPGRGSRPDPAARISRSGRGRPSWR